jgi:hypothetical protein
MTTILEPLEALRRKYHRLLERRKKEAKKAIDKACPSGELPGVFAEVVSLAAICFSGAVVFGPGVLAFAKALSPADEYYDEKILLFWRMSLALFTVIHVMQFSLIAYMPLLLARDAGLALYLASQGVAPADPDAAPTDIGDGRGLGTPVAVADGVDLPAPPGVDMVLTDLLSERHLFFTFSVTPHGKFLVSAVAAGRPTGRRRPSRSGPPPGASSPA